MPVDKTAREANQKAVRPLHFVARKLTKNAAAPTLLLAVALLSGCETHPAVEQKPLFAEYRSPYAGNSAVGISRILEEDAIRSLKYYLKKEFGTDEFEIIDRVALEDGTEFGIDGLGRMVAGRLHEVWTVRCAGQVRKLEFIMFPDGQHGHTVGFKAYQDPG